MWWVFHVPENCHYDFFYWLLCQELFLYWWVSVFPLHGLSVGILKNESFVRNLNIVVFLFRRYRRRFWQSCDCWSLDILRSKFYIFFVADIHRRRPVSFASAFQAAQVCKLSYVNLFSTPRKKCKFLTTAISISCSVEQLWYLFMVWNLCHAL